MHPVSVEFTGGEIHSTGVGFDDYQRMQAHRRKLASHRHGPAPDWAFNTAQLRAIIVRCMERRALIYKPLPLTEDQRLLVAQKVLEEKYQPELVARINRLCKEYVAAKNAKDTARVTELAPKVEECDTALRLVKNAPYMLAGVVYHYYRRGVDSVETGRALHLKPPHVRRLVMVMGKVAGELGYAPPKIAKVGAARAAKKRDCAKAKRFAALLHKGYTWPEAKAKMGDSRPNNYYWRALCAKHKVALPVRPAGAGRRWSRTRDEQLLPQARTIARMLEQGKTWAQARAAASSTRARWRDLLKRHGLTCYSKNGNGKARVN